MPPDISQIILEEIRDFKAADQEWKQDTGERIQNMETSVAMVLNGDMEGSLPHLQKRVRALEKKQYTLAGAFGLLGTLIGWALRFVPVHLK